jgi:hypothetical protein
VCLLLHVASDEPLTHIECSFENHPEICVSTVAEPPADLSAKFTKPIIHYIGAFGCCGCDFGQTDDPTPNAARAAFARYLKQHGPSGSTVEVYFAWADDIQFPCEHELETTVDELTDRDDVFLERQLMRIRIP